MAMNNSGYKMNFCSFYHLRGVFMAYRQTEKVKEKLEQKKGKY